MNSSGMRFNVLRRLLHWLMAACILAMFFIGVGMVSTVMPKYVPLLLTHRTLGITILVLALIRLGVRARYGAPPLPADLPEPMKLAAQLSHYALYALMIGMPLIGWGMLSAGAYPVVLYGNIVSRHPSAEQRLAYAALECALLPGVRILRAGPASPCRCAFPCAGSTGRRLREHGAGAVPRRGRPRRMKARSAAGPETRVLRKIALRGPVGRRVG
jgi:cytochrome b561